MAVIPSILNLSILIAVMNFVNEPVNAYVLVMLKVNVGLIGGVAPGAALTLRKRGPCPPRTGREGRLPTLPAAGRRPLFLLGLLVSTYMKFLDTLWMTLESM